MKIAFVIAACLAASLVCLDAHQQPGGRGGEGGHGGGREGGHGGGGKGMGGGKYRGQRGNFTGDVYKWNRTDGEDEPFTEIAFIKTNSTVVFVISLGNQNYLKAKSIYDFRDETNARVVYVVGNGTTPKSCFLSTTSRTFDELKAELKSRNNTEIVTGDIDDVILITGGPPLPVEEVNALGDNMLSRFCATILPVVPPVDDPLSSNGMEITFFDLFNLVTIFIPLQDE